MLLTSGMEAQDIELGPTVTQPSRDSQRNVLRPGTASPSIYYLLHYYFVETCRRRSSTALPFEEALFAGAQSQDNVSRFQSDYRLLRWRPNANVNKFLDLELRLPANHQLSPPAAGANLSSFISDPSWAIF